MKRTSFDNERSEATNDTETTNSAEPIERISATSTIEVGPDAAKVIVKRVDDECLSSDAHKIQTIMMLVTSKAMQEMAGKIFGKPVAEASKWRLANF